MSSQSTICAKSAKQILATCPKKKLLFIRFLYNYSIIRYNLTWTKDCWWCSGCSKRCCPGIRGPALRRISWLWLALLCSVDQRRPEGGLRHHLPRSSLYALWWCKLVAMCARDPPTSALAVKINGSLLIWIWAVIRGAVYICIICVAYKSTLWPARENLLCKLNYYFTQKMLELIFAPQSLPLLCQRIYICTTQN